MLQEAIIKGELSLVKRILDNEDESFKTSQRSCICLAASQGHWDIVELLVEFGFDVNQEDAHGHTPVYHTVGHNEVKTTEILLQNGAKTNGKYNLIFLAARRGFGDIVKILIDFGANVNAKDDFGQTPLHHAILQDSAMFIFVEKNAISKTGLCAMEYVVDVLLSNGSDANAKTVNGFTSLHFAIKLKYPSVVDILLRFGADFHSLVDCDIKTPKLSQVCRKSYRSSKPRLTTVLHIAVESNDVASVRLLLTAGAAVEAVQFDGATPLIVAVKRGHDKIVRVLMDFGADVEKKNKSGLTPLHVVCRTGSVNVLILLLEAGSNINAFCNRGRLPYQYFLQFQMEIKDEMEFELDMFYNTPRYYRKLYRNILKMKKILQERLVMMYMNGLYLHDYNKDIAMKTPNIFHCIWKKEIEEFSKSCIIFNNVTLYHVINSIRNPLYIRNQNVSKELDKAIAVTNSKYPEFGSNVDFLVKNAKVRVDLIDTGIEWFIHLNRANDHHLPTLPFDVLEIVFSLLLNEDIQNFIYCAEGMLH